ncbi:cell division protein ZapA [Clostridium swellfunianum]|uniref:cell division protein ZapA n=1 Tax=Clostridium swellfunianum TaxID=1367462 RepID=UPI00202FCCB8|nr:cell division protein ZapA [Clostridium swellfunianum]MCM0650607.1 cell division protein ZapA [Clostridium swellfunianum]
MNVINVTINGMEYNLKGSESEEYLHKVARHVDKKIQEILKSNPKLSISSASVLTAINAADEMFKCDTAFEEQQREIDKLNDEKNVLNKEIEFLKKQMKYLEDYNSELQLKLKNSNVMDVDKLNIQLQQTVEEAKNYLEENKTLKASNKELRFQLHSYKYKTMDLQNRLIESGINLAKAKKNSNPFLTSD